MVRRATVAGQFYAGNKEELKKQVTNCFKSKLGSGLPGHKKNNKIIGAVVPHAGYEFSGQCASHVYRKLAEAEQPDTFIIIGVNHQSSKSGVIISLEDFESPLGIVKNDAKLTKQLIKESTEIKKLKKIKKAKINVIHDEDLHAFEHSIEVQLPFLQFITKNKLKIVPIILSDYTYDTCKALAGMIVEASKQLKRKICVLASSDFTHYGKYYSFTPFTENIKKNLYEIDGNAIKKIIKLDGKSFFDYSKNITICGAAAITTAIEYCKLLGAKKAELLKYYTSGDISGDYNTAVGYTSIIFS